MSRLTAELMGRPLRQAKARRWHPTFEAIADRLVAAYGVPSLGNQDDPVDETFYIMLSARTNDAKYRKAHAALRARFPTLASLAGAKREEIARCILGSGLANKRAAHARNLAARFILLGDDPSVRLRQMSEREAFEFLSELPGMGPKSAFCVMMYSLGQDVFPVDVNVQRVASRLGAISRGLKHYQAQQQLPPLVPPGRSKDLHIGLVVLGREVCLPRNPRCGVCPLLDMCPWSKKRSRVDLAKLGKSKRL